MIHHGDCLEILPTLPAESIDSIVTDPPYGLSFMGKNWDHGIPGVAFWSEALRVAKPGTHLLAFGGTRTFHRLTCAIEDAGWEIRDCIMWVYGSGFPKSHDVSKAIDREAGAERKVVGKYKRPDGTDRNYTDWKINSGEWKNGSGFDPSKRNKTAPATPAAQKWQGWGTALKPAWEPIIVARKPLTGTVAANVLQWGTGGINVDGCRVGTDGWTTRSEQAPYAESGWRTGHKIEALNLGRWPSNLIHDGSDEVVGLFPQAKGQQGAVGPQYGHKTSVNAYGDFGPRQTFEPRADSGSAARFFYCAKASKADRDEVCEGIESIHRVNGNKWTDQDYRVTSGERPQSAESGPRRNHHPTVKPTTLMRYLCRLVTPPGGTVLDPFCGSGSTGKAATLEGFKFIGIEREAEYVEIARARIAHAESAYRSTGASK